MFRDANQALIVKKMSNKYKYKLLTCSHKKKFNKKT